MNKNEIEDGIICPKKFGKYPKSKHRILWILKEANDPDSGGWSLTDFLATRVDESEGLFHYSRWAATFGLVIKVSYGLLNGFIDYDKIEKDLKKASESLDYIAVINIKKVSGGSRASLAKVEEEINPQLILKQINEIKPDIVIGGNTLWILAKNNLFLESKDFNQEFADNFKKLDKAGKEVTIEPQNVKMYYKVEHDRYYTGRDEQVRKGLKIQHEAKEGFNVHCHFIVGRKTADGRNRISPTTNNRKEFDRDRLTLRTEQSFDQKTGYDRPLKESYQYMNTMKNGTGLQKSEMLQKAVTEELRQGVLLKSKDLDKLISPEKILEKVKLIPPKLSRGLSI